MQIVAVSNVVFHPNSDPAAHDFDITQAIISSIGEDTDAGDRMIFCSPDGHILQKHGTGSTAFFINTISFDVKNADTVNKHHIILSTGCKPQTALLRIALQRNIFHIDGTIRFDIDDPR